MTSWIAVAYGALDVADSSLWAEGADLVVVPTKPSMPLALFGEGARLWRRLVDEGAVASAELSAEESAVIEEMADAGLAAPGPHPAHITTLSPPALSSPMHELVYALIANVAREERIRVAFIKGPILHAQGLREREHSGDVDLWLDAEDAAALVRALDPWGWSPGPSDFVERMHHSTTLYPREWGCEIDVHTRFPGVAIEPAAAFDLLWQRSESVVLASASCSAPRGPDHAVIQALHLLRPNPKVTLTERDRTAAISGLRAAGAEAIPAAIDFGTLPILRDVLAGAFPGAEIPEPNGSPPRDWELLKAPTTARYHLAVIGTMPWRARPRAIWRAIWPSAEVAQLSAHRAHRAPRTVLGARLWRLWNGVRQLVRGVE